MKCSICWKESHILFINLTTGNKESLCRDHYFEWIMNERISYDAFILKNLQLNSCKWNEYL